MIVLFVLTAIGFVSCDFGSSEESNTIGYLNTLQIIRKFGYPAESHIVETADGYLLEMHRIPHGKNTTFDSSSRKPPVFMHHGLLGSSSDYFLNGTEMALPFLLSDLGFDIWLGNARGNAYSRAHVNLSPKDNEFWNYSWHETAIYDVPAEIDYVCNYTNQEKVIYVGFSMGTTVFFAMTSTLPEYNEKIEISLLMAAVGYVEHIKSPLLRFLAPFSDDISEIVYIASHGEFFSEDSIINRFVKIMCQITRIEERFCRNVIFLVVGSDPKEFDWNSLPVLLNHYPQGYSVKAVNHYSQLVKSGKFRQYDYGKAGNRKEYGTSTPPEYNFKAITTPMYFYEGKNDYLSSMKDVENLSKQLSSLRRVRVVDYPLFSHLDFLLSYDVKKFVYDVLIRDLTSHLNDNNDVNF